MNEFRQLHWMPVFPSDYLKMHPVFDDDLDRVVARIRRPVAQGTMWAIPAPQVRELRARVRGGHVTRSTGEARSTVGEARTTGEVRTIGEARTTRPIRGMAAQLAAAAEKIVKERPEVPAAILRKADLREGSVGVQLPPGPKGRYSPGESSWSRAWYGRWWRRDREDIAQVVYNTYPIPFYDLPGEEAAWFILTPNQLAAVLAALPRR